MVCKAGETGPRGKLGDVGFEGIEGKPGLNGFFFTEGFETLPFLPVKPTVRYLALLLHKAELNILNNEISIALDQLTWIQKLINNTRTRTNLATDYKITLSRFDARIHIILKHLINGLDLYGRSHNYIVLVEYDELEEQLRKQISYIEKVENALIELESSEFDAKQVRKKAKNLTQALNDQIKIVEKSVKTIFSRKKELRLEVDYLTARLDQLFIELLSAQNSLKNAIRRKSGCDFIDVIKFAAMVVTVVQTAGATATLLASTAKSMQTLNKMNSAGDLFTGLSIKELEKTGKTITDVMEPAGEALSDFQTKYQEAKSNLKHFDKKYNTPKEKTSLPSDYVKLVASKKDFDREIHPFLNMSEAKKYKKIMDLFVTTAETRNNKIAEHDSSILRINDLYTGLKLEESKLSDLRDNYLKKSNFELEGYTTYLRTGLDRMKMFALRQIIDLRRTLDYMAVEQSQFDLKLADFSSAALIRASSNELERYSKITEAFGQERIGAHKILVQLKTLIGDEDLKRLKEGKVITLSIPSRSTDAERDPFKYWYGVQTTKISVVGQEGQAIKGKIHAFFEHLGKSAILNKVGEPITFNHVSVSTGYVQGKNDVVSQNGSLQNEKYKEKYVGVSPYGPWKFQIKDADQSVWDNIINLNLSFDISGRNIPL